MIPDFHAQLFATSLQFHQNPHQNQNQNSRLLVDVELSDVASGQLATSMPMLHVRESRITQDGDLHDDRHACNQESCH